VTKIRGMFFPILAAGFWRRMQSATNYKIDINVK
jgi:hypothetical protein